MSTFSKVLLSGSPASGRPIPIVAIVTPGTVIHTADASALDEIWLYAQNSDPADQSLTIEFGGVVAGDLLDAMVISPFIGLVTVLPGIIITGGLVVTGFATAASQISVWGFVNRITG